MFKSEVPSATEKHFKGCFIFPLSYSYTVPEGTVEEKARTVTSTMLPNMKTQILNL